MEGVLKIKRVKQIPQKAPIYIGTCMQSSGKTDLKSNADFQKVGAVEEEEKIGKKIYIKRRVGRKNHHLLELPKGIYQPIV